MIDWVELECQNCGWNPNKTFPRSKALLVVVAHEKNNKECTSDDVSLIEAKKY